MMFMPKFASQTVNLCNFWFCLLAWLELHGERERMLGKLENVSINRLA